ncbi:D-alanyl-D-alanine carboxypeptidase family protein [Bacillus thuringiensis]|uniref:D-alanyl-D-alanine carboxypeptidase family protein n=1 Tax=Bacillus thuringiensis TaxID=1428 RepID=UPI0021D647E6|nr:D-alanyl-D-alanine carboxypeptidase family protein [Bacillus thuringiensis]MCU7666954.1 D-alanyl-D-alanine carboxypeptidase [Bacillus thuringiensis]
MKKVAKQLKKPLIGVMSLLVLATAPSAAFAEKEDTHAKKKVKAAEVVKMPELPIESEAAFVYDMNLKKVIYEKNADEVIKTASLAKVMTLFLASDDLAAGKVKENDKVLVSEKSWKTGGSRMFLEVGREVPFGEAFKGVAVVSGNDAAVAIAEHLAGSTDEFVKRMNKKAKELKMTHTNYRSVNGLPDGDLDDTSTPRDLGNMTVKYLKKYPGNLKIHSLQEFSFDTGRGVIKQKNRNPLLGEYTGADGLKTGWIDGHYNLIGTAEKGGVRLVIVTMKGATEQIRAKDAKILLDYGFNQYNKYVLNKKGEKVATLPVYKASEDKKAEVVMKNEDEVVIHSSQLKGKQKVKEKLVLPDYINAGKGMKAGDLVGKKQYFIGKKLIHESDVVLKEGIEKGNWWQKTLDSILLSGMWIIGLFK